MRTKTAQLFILAGLILAFVILAIVPQPAIAATNASNCRAVHKVAAGDTLNRISEKYNIDLLTLVKLNNIYKDAGSKSQRRNIYVGQSICIVKDQPAWDGKHPTWADWPAADYTATLEGNNLVFRTTWFNYPSAFNIKIGGKKIDGLLRVKYHVTKQSVTLPKNLRTATQVCIKNVATDALVCRPIKK